jgi:regulator of ribonuclease activity A
MTKSRKGGRPVGETLGGILAGFDQQIMRNQPPPHELVHKGAPVRGLSGEDGGEIEITLHATPPDGDASAAERETAVTTSTSDLMDEHPDDLDVCDLQFRQYGALHRFSGRIRTVRCHEDNVLLRDLLAGPGLGDVLVVDGGGSLRTALLGDQVAGSAVDHGWAGIIINGCVRDVDALATLRIGIKALGSNPRKSGKAGDGAVDVPVTFGGATFHPGAWLTSDEDGIVVTRTSSPPS